MASVLIKWLSIFLLFGFIATTFSASDLSSNNTNVKAQRCESAKKFVKQLNNQEIGEGKWAAVYRERFASLEPHVRKRMNGLRHVPFPSVASNSTVPNSNPEKNQSTSGGYRRRKRATSCSYTYTFDARTQWPGCGAVINSIRDQSGCGGCWAVASASVFTDRYCIQRAKAGVTTSATNANNFFSDADVLSCTPTSNGCDGGSPYYAWQYMQSNGVVTGTNYTWNSGCKPYPFAPNSNSLFTAPSCSSSCTNSKWSNKYSADKKYASSMGWLQSSTATVANIQAEIKANGPVVASMDVYDDFYYYSSGVYKRTSSTYEGGHAIRLIGWGDQKCTDGSTQPFWLAINSWNTDWGMNGLFLIARGSNECGIEQMGIFYGTPKI